jgi:prefoldin subunit 5
VLDVQIGKLRADYDTVARLQNKKIQQYKALIAASANTLQRDIDALTGQLAAKEKELSEYQKTLVDIHKVLREGKGIHFSQEERQNFEERTLMLSEKIRPLADEVQELKLQIRLKKQKVGYLN